MSRRGKRWSRSFGPYGCRVRVWESRSGLLYAETRAGGRSRRESLKHRDRDRAVAWGRAEQAKLALGIRTLRAATPTAARVFALYLAQHSPTRTRSTQLEDQRRVTMWECVLGSTKDLEAITRAEWERFARERAAGALSALGEPVPEAERRPVRARTVGADQEWLRGVILWAGSWQDEAGAYLMRENALRGYAIAKERNPRRPVATADRYEATRRQADQVHPMLGAILDVVNGTGRRVSAVLQLRYQDLRLDVKPFGAIRWPSDTDKMEREWSAPIGRQVRAALDQLLERRPGIGAAYLFPSPRSAARAVSKRLASRWLVRAEQLAKLPKLSGSLWHAYRRKWGTERKHLPLVDVAAAGGWKSSAVLRDIYQQPDPDTLIRVITEAVELREATPGGS